MTCNHFRGYVRLTPRALLQPGNPLRAAARKHLGACAACWAWVRAELQSPPPPKPREVA